MLGIRGKSCHLQCQHATLEYWSRFSIKNLKRSKRKLRKLGPCHPRGRPANSPWLLELGWMLQLSGEWASKGKLVSFSPSQQGFARSFQNFSSDPSEISFFKINEHPEQRLVNDIQYVWMNGWWKQNSIDVRCLWDWGLFHLFDAPDPSSWSGYTRSHVESESGQTVNNCHGDNKNGFGSGFFFFCIVTKSIKTRFFFKMMGKA